MTATELRIGNYINYANSVEKLDAELFLKLLKYTSPFDPIPITKEWLLKFGFKKERNFVPTYSIGKIQIYLDCEIYPKGRVYFNSLCIIKEKPKYVNQLQNLYFALMGKELTFKSE